MTIDLRTVECLRGRLLAERQVSRSAKEEAEVIARKMEELEKHLKEEIKLRKKAEKRLKFLMKKLELIKGSHSSEGSEQSYSSEASCLSSVSTSASNEEEGEEQETHGKGFVEEEKVDQATESVASIGEESSSMLIDVSSSETSVFALQPQVRKENHRLVVIFLSAQIRLKSSMSFKTRSSCSMLWCASFHYKW